MESSALFPVGTRQSIQVNIMTIYQLYHKSAYTTYVVAYYASVDVAVRDCERRYGMPSVMFKPNERGVLTTFIYSDTYVTLELYRIDVITEVEFV